MGVTAQPVTRRAGVTIRAMITDLFASRAIKHGLSSGEVFRNGSPGGGCPCRVVYFHWRPPARGAGPEHARSAHAARPWQGRTAGVDRTPLS